MTSARSTATPAARARATAAGQPRLLIFFSGTCGACRKADSFLAQVLQRRANHDSFKLVRIDRDLRPDLHKRFEVVEIPTLIVISEGRVRARLIKPTGCTQIRELLSPWLR